MRLSDTDAAFTGSLDKKRVFIYTLYWGGSSKWIRALEFAVSADVAQGNRDCRESPQFR